MVGSKVVVFLCVALAIASAAPALPLDLSGLLGTVGNVVNSLLGSVDQILNSLTKEVTQLLTSLTKILNIPVGQNPLAFVQNLITQLDDILSQLLGTVGSGVNDVLNEVEDVASGLTGDLSGILSQLTKILNIPQGANLVGFLTQLIASLEQLIQQVLIVVSKLVKELLGGAVNLNLLNGILADLELASLLQTLVGSLQKILDIVKVANV